jgi:hypothetical protein
VSPRAERNRLQELRPGSLTSGSSLEPFGPGLTSLREGVLERDWAAWDKEIEGDTRSGKLHKLLVRGLRVAQNLPL